MGRMDGRQATEVVFGAPEVVQQVLDGDAVARLAELVCQVSERSVGEPVMDVVVRHVKMGKWIKAVATAPPGPSDGGRRGKVETPSVRPCRVRGPVRHVPGAPERRPPLPRNCSETQHVLPAP